MAVYIKNNSGAPLDAIGALQYPAIQKDGVTSSFVNVATGDYRLAINAIVDLTETNGLANISLEQELIDLINSGGIEVVDENDVPLSITRAISVITLASLSDVTGAITNTTYAISNNDANIYADGSSGSIDPITGNEGWYYKNPLDPTDKINWYYINNFNVTSSMTLSGLNGMYAIIEVYSDTVAPYFNFYTKRKNDGQDTSWYRSRVSYNDPNILAGYVGQTVIMYWGTEPDIYPDYPRIEVPLDPFSTVGPQDADEEIFIASLSTSTGYPADSFEFTSISLGYYLEGVNYNLPCIAHNDLTEVVDNVNDIILYLNAVETGRYARGYANNSEQMADIANPQEQNYIGRLDTGTIWQYTGGVWVDTLITLTAPGSGALDAQIAGYSNTHYIDLDGTNDHIDLDTGVNANVLDYTQTWALGFEIESVSGVDDSTYTTLWKRGNNEITLHKGGSNWGVYFYANGNSVGQANTWRRPEAGSKVLFICNGSQVKYYLYSPSNGEVYQATMTLNQTNVTNHNNATGNLQLGQMGVIGSNWFGGVNNALIMEGSGSDLGTNQISEYFGGQDVTLMSFYEDVEDFLPLGEDTYPTVTGTKGVISGNLINGTTSDFVER